MALSDGPPPDAGRGVDTLEEAARNADHIVRCDAGIRPAPLAHRLQVDLRDRHLAGDGIDPPYLDIAAPETGQATRRRDRAGHGQVTLYGVSARALDLALNGNILAGRGRNHVAVAEDHLQADVVLHAEGAAQPQAEDLGAAVERAFR